MRATTNRRMRAAKGISSEGARGVIQGALDGLVACPSCCERWTRSISPANCSRWRRPGEDRQESRAGKEEGEEKAAPVIEAIEPAIERRQAGGEVAADGRGDADEQGAAIISAAGR